jgi:hypothetical protein
MQRSWLKQFCKSAVLRQLRSLRAGELTLICGEETHRFGDNRSDLQATLHCVCAHAHAALGELEEAAACYQASVALFREIGRITMPPEPIAGLARIALASGDGETAVATVAEIVAHFDGGGSIDGTEDPLWIYLTCHDVLAAEGAPRAEEFLTIAHRLLQERAALLGDDERASFLANVPTNRAVVAAWARTYAASA